MAEEARRPSARREATRQRVLDAARDVFAERGVLGASVEDITEAANFTRGAFYSNFPDKLAVVRELLTREYERLLATLDGVFEEPDGVLGMPVDPEADEGEVIARVVGRFLDAITGDRKVLLAQAELELAAIRTPELASAYQATAVGIRSRFADFLVKGAARLGRELTVDPLDAVDAVMAIAERSSRRTLVAPDAEPDGLARRMLPVILLAVTREAPRPDGPATPDH